MRKVLLLVICVFAFCSYAFAQSTTEVIEKEQKEKLMKKRLVDESMEKIRIYYANKYYDLTIEECNNLDNLDANNSIANYYRELAKTRLDEFEKEKKRAKELGLPIPELPKPKEMQKTAQENNAPAEQGKPPLFSEQAQTSASSQLASDNSQSNPFPSAQNDIKPDAQNPQTEPAVAPSSSGELSPYEPEKSNNFLQSTFGKAVLGAVAFIAIALIGWTIMSSKKKRKALMQTYSKIQHEKLEKIEDEMIASEIAPESPASESLDFKPSSKSMLDMDPSFMTEPSPKPAVEKPLEKKEDTLVSGLSSLSGFMSDFDKKPEEKKPQETKPESEGFGAALKDLSSIDLPSTKESGESMGQTFGDIKSLDYGNISDGTFNKQPEAKQQEDALKGFELPVFDEKPQQPSQQNEIPNVPVFDMLELPSLEGESASSKAAKEYAPPQEIELPVASDSFPEPVKPKPDDSSISIGSPLSFEESALPEIDSIKKEKPLDFPEPLSFDFDIAKTPQASAPQKNEATDKKNDAPPAIDLSDSSLDIKVEIADKSSESVNSSVALDEFLFDSSPQDSVGGSIAPASGQMPVSEIPLPDFTDNFATSSFNVENEETMVSGASTQFTTQTQQKPPETEIPKVTAKPIPQTKPTASQADLSADDEDTKLIFDKKDFQIKAPAPVVAEKKNVSDLQGRPPLEESLDVTSVSKDYKVEQKPAPPSKPFKKDMFVENVPGLNFDLETESTIGFEEKEIKASSSEAIGEDEKLVSAEAIESGEFNLDNDISNEKTSFERTPLPIDKTKDRNELLFNEQFKKGIASFNKKDWKKAVHYLTIAAAIKPNDTELKDKLRIARENRKEGTK